MGKAGWGCPACDAKRLHTKADWEHHPEAGHGFTGETRWTLPYLNPQAPPISDLIDRP